MEIKINTKEDSHDDIRKAIKMLQHIIGDPQETYTNEPQLAQESSQSTGSAFNSIFGDTSNSSEASVTPSKTSEEQTEEASESTEDLFAELFSEEELKKMEPVKEEEELPKTKSKKPSIELY